MHAPSHATLHRVLWLRVFAVVVLAGCGRVRFDDVSGSGAIDASGLGDDAADATLFVCNPIGHDEDADGTDDACDVCPHLSGSQQDGDGDRVGDDCDLEPTLPNQQIVFFDAFSAFDPAWTTDNGASVGGDELVLDAVDRSRSIHRPYTLGQDWFLLGLTTGPSGAGNHLVSLVTSPNSGGTGFYCEMYNDGTTVTMFTYSPDGASFLHDGIATWAQPLVNGGGTFEYLLTGPEARCRSVWNGDVRSTVGTRPATITPERLTLYAENIDAQVAWIIQIRTLP